MSLLYTKSHEWVKFNEDESCAYVGISAFAAQSLGDIVYVDIDLDMCSVGQSLGDIESVKAVEEIISPLSGTITEVNNEVQDDSSILNEKPEEIWLCKVENITDRDDLLTEQEYQDWIKK